MDTVIFAVRVALRGIRSCLSLLSYYDSREGKRSNVDSVLDAYADLYANLYLLEDKPKTGPFEPQKSPHVADWIESCCSGLVDAEKQLNEHFVQVPEVLTQHSYSWRRIVERLSPLLWPTHEYLDRKGGRTWQLWVCGSADCGKTTLCSMVMEDLKPLCGARFGKFGSWRILLQIH